jgi:hypothetical protein
VVASTVAGDGRQALVPAPTARILAAAASADGARFAVSSDDKTLAVWTTAPWALLATQCVLRLPGSPLPPPPLSVTLSHCPPEQSRATATFVAGLCGRRAEPGRGRQVW